MGMFDYVRIPKGSRFERCPYCKSKGITVLQTKDRFKQLKHLEINEVTYSMHGMCDECDRFFLWKREIFLTREEEFRAYDEEDKPIKKKVKKKHKK